MPIRIIVQHTFVHDPTCHDAMMSSLCLTSSLNFVVVLVLDDTSLLNSSDFSITILLCTSLSRCVHPRYTWSVIRIGSSKSSLLSAIFHPRKLIEISHVFNAYVGIHIVVLFPSFFQQLFCEFSLPQQSCFRGVHTRVLVMAPQDLSLCPMIWGFEIVVCVSKLHFIHRQSFYVFTQFLVCARCEDGISNCFNSSFLLAHAMGRGPKWSRDQLEDAARLFEASVGPLEVVTLRPHWPLSTVKKLHAKLKKDVLLVRDVTTTVVQSWSADAQAGAAFLEEDPEASAAEVARHLRAEHRDKNWAHLHETKAYREDNHEVDRMNTEQDTHKKGIKPKFHRRLTLLAAANGGHIES